MPELHTRNKSLAKFAGLSATQPLKTFNRATEARTNYLFRLLDVMSAQDGAYNLRNRFCRSVDRQLLPNATSGVMRKSAAILLHSLLFRK